MASQKARSPWWQGTRGEWYVVVQVALFVLVLLGPRTWHGLPAWPAALALSATVLGLALMVGGGGLMLAAFFNLGRNLTPLPYPKEDGQLVDRGAYGLVRHPIYCGGLALAFGWALAIHGPLTFGYAVLLLVFLDMKSRREECWLCAKFPGYPSYQKRVRKLIPYIY
jgi:protein-S-isoprenylcysteine O-methyltransferase Ste14